MMIILASYDHCKKKIIKKKIDKTRVMYKFFCNVATFVSRMNNHRKHNIV